eukprot:403375442
MQDNLSIFILVKVNLTFLIKILDLQHNFISPTSDGPAVRSRNSGNGIKKSNSSNSQGPNGSGTFNENDTFNKHYNKELRVSKDEIPIVLAELNDSSIQFIKREMYEKALNLLQKAYGIMDVVDFDLCRRDRFHLFILFHNMALCYQKMQMLDECAQCIEQSLEYLPMDQFNLQEKSISNRMKKLQILGKLKMQYCAILSQVHRHKDALDQAKEGVKISHLLINDMKQLAEFYVKREEIEKSVNLAYNKSNSNISRSGKNNNNANDDPQLNYSSYYSGKKESNKANSSRNKSFSQFLSQQEAYQSEDIKTNRPQGVFHKRQESFSSNLSSFYSLNYLEESMSYLERTAKKLVPILSSLKKRMIPEKNLKEINSHSNKNRIESLDSYQEDMNSDNDVDENNPNSKNQIIDMKNILGYLNQGEWTQTLSIGSIMQLQPFSLRDLLEQGKNELELTRDSFIAKVSFLAVSYFCYSTEIRFILQMKEDPSYDPSIKQKESEYWHAKSLEVACSFLPGECPLLNHINLSYQKHFAPVKTTIMEDEPNNDDLIVVKPMNGIDNPKFQPIIRQVQNINISITPYQMTPINQIANEFLSQMISFNDYQEQSNIQHLQSVSYSNKLSQNHQKSKSGDATNASRKSKKIISKTKRTQQSYDQLIDDDIEHLTKMQNQSVSNPPPGNFDQSDDLKKFEELFEKLMKENKIDKSDLLRKLKQSQDKQTTGTNQMLEEGESSQFNDLLLDEHILAEESIDEENIAIEAKHQNSNSNNLYKFRNKDGLLRGERPKTSHSIHRMNNHSIGGTEQELQEKDKTVEERTSFARQQVQHIEDNKKKSQRPLSGGLQKIKNESHRSRINKMNQNYSMYEKFGQSAGAQGGFSPDKNAQLSNNVGSKNSIAPPQNFTQYQNQQIAQGYSNPPPKSAQQNKSFDAHSKINMNQPTTQQQLLQQQKQNQSLLVHDKKQPLQAPGNIQAYDELKRRLLNEYKKLTTNKKSFDDQVRERYKNMKQRAASGKKNPSASNPISLSSNQTQQTATNQAQTAQQFAQSSQQTGQLSPKHHLNVYKPTFIINNSFANESGNQSTGTNQGKEVDVVDQISKKYRPSSKSNSNQQTQSQPSIQQIGNLQNAPSGRGSLVMPQNQQQQQLYHERSGSQYVNQPQVNSQQLMGMLMNPEKKPLNPGSKKNLKTHALSQGQQDLSFVKQFLNDKNTQNLKGIYPNQPTQANYTQQQQQQQQQQHSINNSFTAQQQPSYFQTQSQQQFIQNKPLISTIDQQQLHKQKQIQNASGSGPKKQVSQTGQILHASSSSQMQLSSGIANNNSSSQIMGMSGNTQQKLAAYEKLKKKLNYHVNNNKQ